MGTTIAPNVNVDLRSLLQQVETLDPARDVDKMKEVAGRVATALPLVSQAQLAALSPADQKTLKQLSGIDSFQKNLGRATVTPYLAEFLTRVGAPIPEGALKGRVEIESALKSGQAKKTDEAAPNPIQAAANNFQVGGPLDGLIKDLQTFAGSLKDNRFKTRLDAEIKRMQEALMSVQIEAEGFQGRLMKECLAYLAGKKNNLTPDQKKAIDEAFPVEDNPVRKKLTDAVSAGFDPSKIEALKTLPTEEQYRIRAEMMGKQAAFAHLMEAGRTGALTEAQKAWIAGMLSDKVPDAPYPATPPRTEGETPTPPTPSKPDAATTEAAKPSGSIVSVSDAEIAEIPDEKVRQSVREFRDDTRAFNKKADDRYNEIMSLLNSGLPIELVIMLVMSLMGQGSEDKLRLKMKEQALAERLEKVAKEQGLQLKFQMKASSELQQEIQIAMQQWTQMMQMISGVLRMIQDMTMTPIRNIR